MTMKYMEKAAGFLESITSKDGVIVVYNNDMDGIAACVLVKKYLASKGNKPYIIAQPMPPEQNFIRRVQTSLPDKIIFLDMAMDSDINILKKLRGISKILVIDHHIIVRDLNNDGIVHYNPRFENPNLYQCTAYVVHKILARMKLEPESWIAMLGAVGDYDLTGSKELVKDAEKYASMEKYRSIVNMIESSRIAKMFLCDQLVDIVSEAKNPDELLENKKLAESASVVESEINKELANAAAAMEKHGNLLLYHSASKYNLRSVLSTKLGEKHRNKAVIVYGLYGKKMVGSVRNQDGKINAINMLNKASQGIKGAAFGGHDNACGFSVPEAGWKEFRDKLIKAAENG